MTTAARRPGDRGALEIVDEAVHLLRRAPAGTLLLFYAGSLPFILGLLTFWEDMRRSALARRHDLQAALGLALLYLWMKILQAAFARRLRGSLGAAAPPPRRWRERLHDAAVQSGWQPTSLFVLPLAFLIMLPFGWVTAFYHSLGVTSDYAAAKRQTMLWPRQNHLMILFLHLFGLLVFLDILIALFIAPFLLHALLGIDTPIARSPMTLFNSTMLAAACGFTYLAMAPLVRAAYVLRCFYGDSLRTGEDLLVELRVRAAEAGNGAERPARRAGLVALLLAALLAGSGTARAAPPAPGGAAGDAAALRTAASPAAERTGAASGGRISAAALDRSVAVVLERREFAWRLPRPPLGPRQRGVIGRFIDGVVDTLLDWARALGRQVRRLLDWLARRFRLDTSPDDGSSWSLRWINSVQGLFLILLVASACLVAVWLWRMRRRRAPLSLAGAAATPPPDIATDDSSADRVPAEAWLDHARALAAAGDLRAAVRAYYLAGLSDLARRDLLTLARHKTNLDYRTELGRRGRSRPRLADLFAENVRLFEATWYGRHPASVETVRAVAGHLQEMRADA
jgi:Domain of unknown function (DUF4129)